MRTMQLPSIIPKPGNGGRINPSEQHFTLLAKLIEQIGTAGNLTTDAHLAALAIERGLILQTTDADFARFPRLKWSNPIAKET